MNTMIWATRLRCRFPPGQAVLDYPWPGRIWHNKAMRKTLDVRLPKSLTVFLAAAVLLGACGDSGKDKSKTKKAAGILNDYYYSLWRAPSPDWEIRKVRPGGDNTVTVEAKIMTKTLSRAIMERSKAEQMEIARLACPPYIEEIWAELGKDQPVGIVLSGTAGHIINALCKRPR